MAKITEKLDAIQKEIQALLEGEAFMSKEVTIEIYIKIDMAAVTLRSAIRDLQKAEK